MPPLSSNLRGKLENTVIAARDAAEEAAWAALERLAVGRAKLPSHLTPQQRELRRKLRARGKQLGDQRHKNAEQDIHHLARECAYEHWHQMLFARFLAENQLLMHPDGVAVSLEECEELAAEEGTDGWTLAARYASRMLPRIFRPDDPLLAVAFAPEDKQALEKLLADLPVDVFTSDDSLGWVYQFWQTKRKKEVNDSGEKIGADELPAVTQLFTEDYMVKFLLHNTLGAWWACKVAAASSRWSSCTSEADCRRLVAVSGVEWEYLRFVEVDAASSRIDEDKRLDAASTIGFYRKGEPVANLSGNLPHWRQEAVTYFVTFRTADSLPQEKLWQWQAEKDQWLAEHPEPRDAETMQQYYERFPERIERWLDQGYGECLLKQPGTKGIVEDALRHFDGERYFLDEFVVAANHVHVTVTPREGHELSAILHSWKSFTANQINKLLRRSGALWQKESFDHIVRNPDQLERHRHYMREHTVAAASSRMNEDVQAKRQDAASTWRPAAGTFDGWPKQAAELKIMDPCCGSGHFLVAAFDLMVRIRMEEEDLSAAEASDAVLRDNLHGLEIDQRCTQIAAFALAFAVWTFPDAGGYRELPELHIACTGIAPQATEEQWVKLAEESGVPMPREGKEPILNGLINLHRLFSEAPTLGSLITPSELPSDLIAADYETLGPYLKATMSPEQADNDTHERAVAAQGMVKAAEMLTSDHTLVATNVPFRQTDDFNEQLSEFVRENYPDAKSDIATICYCRMMALLAKNGVMTVVLPQGFLYKDYYSRLRKRLFNEQSFHVVARLGAGAFREISGEEVKVCLVVSDLRKPSRDHVIVQYVVTDGDAAEKEERLPLAEPVLLPLSEAIVSTKHVLASHNEASGRLLEESAWYSNGIQTGDYPRFGRCFWEIAELETAWSLQLSTVKSSTPFGGREHCIFWEQGCGQLIEFITEKVGEGQVKSWVRGLNCRNHKGVAISAMGELKATLYDGELFDDNTVVIIPNDETKLAALWEFCRGSSYNRLVREIDQSQKVRGALLRVAYEETEYFPGASVLPEPRSYDPTQWLFHGHPEESTVPTEINVPAPLHVAVARLLGYRWPAELDEEMRLSERARALVEQCDELLPFADEDGIVCIPAVAGEASGADRLQSLLSVCGVTPTENLDAWLREKFFEEHCQLFHQRPFIWHIWDGRRKDGFHALVNYHKLCGSGFQPLAQSTAGSRSHQLLEKLIYGHLGDWISRQQGAERRGESGAEARRMAAEDLQQRLKLILEGEPPYDIFVRWKPLEEQPIGWDPNLNDGVRLNIRPFVTAGVLRKNPKIKWKKDRGKEPERPKDQYPWFWGWDEETEDFMGGPTFDGNRWNDCHYSSELKLAAREGKLQSKGKK